MLVWEWETPGRKPLPVASELRCRALVVDTETGAQLHGRSVKLAEALGARYVTLEALQQTDGQAILL